MPGEYPSSACLLNAQDDLSELPGLLHPTVRRRRIAQREDLVNRRPEAAFSKQLNHRPKLMWSTHCRTADGDLLPENPANLNLLQSPCSRTVSNNPAPRFDDLNRLAESLASDTVDYNIRPFAFSQAEQLFAPVRGMVVDTSLGTQVPGSR